MESGDSLADGIVIQVSFESAPGITMGRPYSQDLRERVIAAMDDGDAYELPPLFHVSVSLHQGAGLSANDW
jgi:hypothetical protein